MYLWNELSQPELDALTYALLKAMGGGKTAAHKSSEHAWEALCALPGVSAADADTIRDVVHTLHRVGFLVGVEDKGDTVACGGLTQAGLARLRGEVPAAP